eukprot:gene3115-biopygen5285
MWPEPEPKLKRDGPDKIRPIRCIGSIGWVVCIGCIGRISRNGRVRPGTAEIAALMWRPARSALYRQPSSQHSQHGWPDRSEPSLLVSGASPRGDVRDGVERRRQDVRGVVQQRSLRKESWGIEVERNLGNRSSSVRRPCSFE